MKKIVLISLLFSCKLFSASTTLNIFAYALENNLKPIAISVFKHIDDQRDKEAAKKAFTNKYHEDIAALTAVVTSATTAPVGQLPAELTAAMSAVPGNDTEKALAGFRFIMTDPAGSGKAVINQLKSVDKQREVAEILDQAKS
jgi:hypothetical protein